MAAKEIGTSGRPNKYTRWYANSLGKGRAFLRSEWCAIYLAWSAQQAGVRTKTGTAAWTVAWANWYARKGMWRAKPQRGAMVFFDWAGGKSRSGIDHVGIVERVHKDGSITSIEGNASDAVRRRHHSGRIVGYGYWA
ncbi:CHAP domain-containing protein [Nonomuraea jabiensis]|uniref:CHAP domain-containing protein n=1 Tax=Nonomuraea jabiensis TaxID=882448 RepID=UPI003D73F613